jgi:hypothetical protein
MYTNIIDQGIIIRDSDGKIVSPCESNENPDFVEYNEWANAGNHPTIQYGNDPNAFQWEVVRTERNKRIAETDYTQLSDASLTPELQLAYKSYRQSLRDITKTQTDPYNIIWPTTPIIVTI